MPAAVTFVARCVAGLQCFLLLWSDESRDLLFRPVMNLPDLLVLLLCAQRRIRARRRDVRFGFLLDAPAVLHCVARDARLLPARRLMVFASLACAALALREYSAACDEEHY